MFSVNGKIMAGSKFLIMPHTTGISCIVSLLFRAPKAAGLSKINMKKENKIEENQK